MTPDVRETWEVRKPEVRSPGGVVSTQHYAASEIGARVLAEGGNAVDAAVTAGLALGTVEPWMSGLGGCGQMIVRLAGESRAWSVDFGLVASGALDPRDYPLDEGRGSDLFNWPAVDGDRNVMGPLSIAVPTYVAGVASALERFGTRSWADCLSPAIELAERGLDADWYATLKIASTAARLAADDECRRVYLPNGFPPCSEWGGPPPRLHLGRLAETLRRLAAAGPRDFYEGAVARSLVADAKRLGAKLTDDDLAGLEVRIRAPLAIRYGNATVHAAPGLTGGASLERVLGLLAEHRIGAGAAAGPRAEASLALAYAEALSTAYAERLATLGHDAEAVTPACTTHLSVVDAQGNLVALTQTLLSLFGSRVMFASSGVLMNNGVMWFDPRPGRPNSMAAGRRPLSNMCPVVVDRGDGDRFALGASGGRRIIPAVMQLVSFLADFGLGLEDAFHAPRIDASGAECVSVDPRFPPEVAAALRERFAVEIKTNGVYPAMYACPNATGALRDGARIGAAYVMSPWALAAPAAPGLTGCGLALRAGRGERVPGGPAPIGSLPKPAEEQQGMNEVLEVPEVRTTETDTTADLIRSRRTIHDFREEPAPPDLVRKALDLARWAPNHHLTEPWHFYLLGPETAAAIARLNAEIVTARQGPEAGAAKFDRWSRIPGWIVVTCGNSDDPLRSREDYAACCCAIHNFSLFLWSEGIGVKWTTGAVTRDPRFYDLAWIDPDAETVVGLVWYGYPAEIPNPARRPLDEVSVTLP